MVEFPRLVLPKYPATDLPACSWMEVGRTGSVEYPLDGIGGATDSASSSPVATSKVLIVGMLIDGEGVGGNSVFIGDHALNVRLSVTWTSSSRTLPFYVPYNIYQTPGLAVFSLTASTSGYLFYRSIA